MGGLWFESTLSYKLIKKMATETLGAHLRNLLTPYKSLLNFVEEADKGNISPYYFSDFLKKFKFNNIKELIEFSYSDKMENNLWREETE